MSLIFQILGTAGRDNALFVNADTGNDVKRILFDCGENVLLRLKHSEVKNIDLIFLSHLHIDHIAGFDFLFRRIYDREKKPLRIFGPEKTIEIIHHRLQGYHWNLHSDLSGKIIVSEIKNGKIVTVEFFASEGFSKKHYVDTEGFENVIYDDKHFAVFARKLNHKIVSVGYSVREKDSWNVDKKKLKETGLAAGAWLNKIKDPEIPDDEKLIVNEKTFEIGYLRKSLLTKTIGERIAYLTDFIFDKDSISSAKFLAQYSDVLICESQYLKDDLDLAEKNFHLVSTQSAEIAKNSNSKKLILFHVSDRYRVKELKRMLEDARKIFAESYFPEEWNFSENPRKFL